MPAKRYIRIPVSVLLSARSLADVDDWVAAHNPTFLAEMRRLRTEEDLPGKGKPLSEILKRRPIKS